MKLTLTNCAIASDGGSIALFFETIEKEEVLVSLDNGIDSKTKNKIFVSNISESPLTYEQELELLPSLECASLSISDCSELLEEVISVIKTR
ncbi:MAG: hypothetical protein AB8B80_11685 [Marinicellaceae bacterium]